MHYDYQGNARKGVSSTFLADRAEQGQEQKIYVQDTMREHRAELWQWMEQGTYFCICGNASRMAKDMDAALKEIIAQHGNHVSRTSQ